jgi:hypothetical protein
MKLDLVKGIATLLWLGVVFGGLHLGYARRNHSDLARRVVNGFKVIYRKDDDSAMRDWLVIVDLIIVFITSLCVAGALAAS